MTRIVRYDPFRTLKRMMWDDSVWPTWQGDDDFEGSLRVDMYEDDSGKSLILETDLPGVKKEDLTVEVTSDSVSIRATRNEEVEEKKREYTYRERRTGTYARTVNLPAQVQPNEVNADFKDGLLKLTMPKKLVVQPEKVTVQLK